MNDPKNNLKGFKMNDLRALKIGMNQIALEKMNEVEKQKALRIGLEAIALENKLETERIKRKLKTQLISTVILVVVSAFINRKK